MIFIFLNYLLVQVVNLFYEDLKMKDIKINFKSLNVITCQNLPSI